MKVPRILMSRRVVQGVVLVVVLAIGVQFTVWVSAHRAGVQPTVSRPPGVEGFLPIGAMLAARHLLHTGDVDPVHPAGLAIFIGICLMSVVVAKSFCSHVCPVGFLSEVLGRLGRRLLGRNLVLPRWLDFPLRGLKLLLLGFFAWAVWWSMSPTAVEAFLASPYARVADAKMWAFFALPSRLTVAVVGLLVVGSLFVRDLWCRYLCPYGALVGILGRLAPWKITRDLDKCTDCRACTKVCPARLPVHSLIRVASIECTSCQDCVVACPVTGCLSIAAPKLPLPWWKRRPALRPVAAVVLAALLFAGTLAGFRLAGHWRGEVGEAEYHRRLQELDSPLYTHGGGRAAATAGAAR